MTPGTARHVTGRGADGSEGGFATVLVTGLVALLVVGALAVTWLGSVVEAAHRAGAAADLAALAGAQAVQQRDEPCSAAASSAVANDGWLVSCLQQGDDVLVEVEATVAPVAGLRVVPAVVRRARAGPGGDLTG